MQQHAVSSAAAIPPPSILYNAYNPTCSFDACLQQVVGLLGDDPSSQFAACTDLFGSPTVSIFTPSIDVVFSTRTSTSSYTDIVVSLTTTTSTAEETVTSCAHVRTGKERYGFEAKEKEARMPSQVFDSVECAVPGSHQLPEPGSLRIGLRLHLRSRRHFDRDRVGLYCHLDCVRDNKHKDRVGGESIVTVVESTVIVQPATTTSTATLDTATSITATITTTTTPVAPTQTAYVHLSGSRPTNDKPLVVVSNYVQWTSTGTGNKIAASVDPSSPWLAGQPDITLWLRDASSTVGVLYFQTAAEAATRPRDVPVNFSLNLTDGFLNCMTSLGHSKLFQCGAYIYLSTPAFAQSGCMEYKLKLSPWLSSGST
ncbi:hypothetical protein QBC34DRAFT_459168 [Podospora aff. communis PSN243]|uniref:Ubiquitin 3 binding protein But2 C-terminal domain-containing protein n=1 Tax=Podospora aff. communis PSN243 TaxID=3040156 RepID=A0AAV9GR50_9PEZI|nr:hypothetical protein QBC34DRAFT_459168 [Podospora aff. communis PSN243]